MMGAYDVFGGLNRDTVALFEPSAMYRLAAIQDPAQRKRAIRGAIASGKVVTARQAQNFLRQSCDNPQQILDVRVITGDFRQVDIPDNSVDLIFTDPPYEEKSVPIYGDLSCFANNVLKPGGCCLAYVGIAFLPEALSEMKKHLSYNWTCCASHRNGGAPYHALKIHNHWKPILWFYKPPRKVYWSMFGDITTGGGKKEKDLHDWQQPIAEAEHFIRFLTSEGQTVLDPMCGSGTTLLAAQQLGRLPMGIEINPDTANNARGRIQRGGTEDNPAPK